MDNLKSIYARNCTAVRIDKSRASAFIDANHRLGATGGRYHYGLFIDRITGNSQMRLQEGTLVAVAVFSNARRWLKNGQRISSYEWIRYASLPNIRVIGGMGKLLQTFIDQVHPDDIMSYADASCQDGGEVYTKLGFIYEGEIERNGFKNKKFRLRLTEL